MLEFLNRPYPFSFQPSRRIKQIVPIGLFAFVFSITFRPPGQENAPNYVANSAFLSFTGVIIGLIIMVLIPYMFPNLFNESKWTLKRNIIWSVGVYLIFITLTSISYQIFFLLHYERSFFSFHTFLWWLYYASIFGIPFSIIINIVNQYYLLKRNLKLATNINKLNAHTLPYNNGLNTLEFNVDKFTKLKIDVSQIVYIEALGNYITIVYDNEGIKKTTIKESLGNIEQKTIQSETIYKSHRSYLININYVHKVSGDAQGLKIHFRDIEKVVPVSRNKTKEFKGIISSRN